MGISNNDDRRKYSRVGFTTRIEIVVDADGEQVVLEASSKDLSQKGVFVETGQQFPHKSHCEISIFLSGGIDDIRLTIQGAIVRQTDTGVGVVFESMDVDTYTHLKNIVRYNSGDEV